MSLDVSSYFVVAVQFWAAARVQLCKSIAVSFVLSFFLEAVRIHLHVLAALSYIYSPEKNSLQLRLRPTNYGL